MRRLAFVHHNDVVALEVSDMSGLGRLLSDNGEPNVEALQKSALPKLLLFHGDH